MFEPGTRKLYSNPGIAMLAYVVSSAKKGDLRTMMGTRIMRPLGVPAGEWSVGYGGKTWNVDGLALVPAWGGGNFSPDATARVARLMLRKGDWEGAQLLSAASVEAVTGDAGTPGNGAQGWWSNAEGKFRGPRDLFYGAGAGHQIVVVVPSLGLIAVRNGKDLASDWDEGERIFIEGVLKTLK
jgi:CubicO group peptidase (beta-lactamase class C family)